MSAFQGLSNTIVTVDSTTLNLVVIGGREVKDTERLHGDRSVRRLVKKLFQCQSELFKIGNDRKTLQMFYTATD